MRTGEPAVVVDDPAADAPGALALAVLSVACTWIAPLLGPLVLRPFMRGKGFAQHYFRLAVVVQIVLLLGVAAAATSNVWPSASTWNGVVALPLIGWSWYASFVCLLAAARGERRSVRPIPPRWVWVPWRAGRTPEVTPSL